MTVTKTKVINDTDVVIKLKQGSAGIFSELRDLQPTGTPGSSFDISLESNTTYREYWCAQQPGPTGNEPRVIFSSDECWEFKVVRIVEEPAGSKKYKWVGTVPREASKVQAAPAASASTSASRAVSSSPADSASASASASPAATSHSPLKKLFRFLGLKQ